MPTRADIMRDNTGWFKEGLSHEQLVAGFRAYISHVQALDQKYQGHLPPEQRSILPPEAAIRRKLDWEASSPEPGKWEYYEPLRNAWDVLTYERYPAGSDYEHLAANSVFGHYQSRLSEKAPNPEVIRLTNPVQVRMIDALTEAADIPHEPGQTEVVIPEKLRHFIKWSMSDEYHNKVKAEAARKRGETPHTHHRIQQTGETAQISSRESRQNSEENAFYAGFWNNVIERSSKVPSGQDPAYYPREILGKFEDMIANREYISDKTKHGLAMRLAPFQDSIRKVRTAYEIVAYPATQKTRGENHWQELIEGDLLIDRDMIGRESVELTAAEQAIVRRLCETPRYAHSPDGKRTLQPKVPFNPDRRIYNYADIIGPAPKR